MFYYYLAKDNLESFSDSVAPLNYEIAEHFYPVVSIFTMEFIADLLSSEIDKPSLTQKELWRWKYFLYPDISQDIPMDANWCWGANEEHALQEGFKPCGGLVISFSLLYQMICGKSILFFKSGFLVKRRQLDDKIENKIARYLSMHTNTTLPRPAVSCPAIAGLA